ncbi:MAG: peptide chain release factor 1 [Burkholderiaceae bacterium]|jgi:peptide chain release factor 1|nr:peptide chain release factor 1 [Burkholderiaceae bacterium]
MKPSLLVKLQQLAERLQAVDRLLSAPDVTDRMDEYRKLSKERSDLTPVVEGFHAYQALEADYNAAQDWINDPELKDFAQEELLRLKTAIEEKGADLQRLLLPKDPNDERNVIVEIRAGTGGDESALFSADLLRMYMRYAERNRWQTEILSANESDLGGYKEVIVRIVGHGAYSKLKFESGGHRVQRVPQTETQGRIHTSACTVAVLPEADEVAEVSFSPDELRIDVFRASGAGGQHVNKTESAVRITHLPTGLVAECQDDRSQHKNKERALKVLAARVRDQQMRELHAKEASARKLMIGSGDRSERIRTYNFPQGRITDHRINLTLYKIDALMDGDIGELTQALMTEHQAEQLSAMADG